MLKTVGIVAAILLCLCFCVVVARAIAPAGASTPASPAVKPYSLPTEEELHALLGDAFLRDQGRKIFGSICSACHGMYGEGTQGPNLQDDYWLHGSTMREIVQTIREGYPQKGMVPWKDSYSPEQIHGLASYIVSLKGCPLGTQRGAEGNYAPITYWPLPAANPPAK